jgi:ParB family chromosome partitioning protein
MARASRHTPAAPDALDPTLEQVPLADLRPHPRNDGTHPPDELAHLKQSLQQHGVYRNVVIATDGTILAGHGVVEAARQLGHTQILAKRMPYGPDDPQALQILVGDNHIARLRIQDDAALVALLQDLSREDPLALLGTGFDVAALAALIANGTVPDFQPVGIDEQGRLDEKQPLECPECGHTWVP